MSKPIKPDDVGSLAQDLIPDFVIQAVNELIVLNWTGNSAIIQQKDIVSLAKKYQEKQFQEKREKNNQHGDYTLPDFDWHWLNVESLYRSNGWKVEYDKPAYCETYEPTFCFTKKK